MRSLLDHQADGIEYTLHSHSIEANVVGGNISPRLIQFHIKLGSGVKYSRIANLSDELALALGVTSCRITRDGHFVKIEIPRPDPVAVKLFPLMRTLPGDLPTNAPILGLDENGVPLLLRLGSPDIAHLLISGTTGSGKTALARSMIASLALQNPPEQLRLLLIDPKGRGYRSFNGLPNLVCPVITDPQDGLHRLRWAVRHMERRDESGVSTPALAIFIDELADLMMTNGREMENLVTRLTQRGREAGIHVIACTQKPAASVIGGLAKSNFPTRIVGKVVSAEDAKVASGVAGSGAEKLMGRGDFLLFSGNEVTRLQGAYISTAEMEQTVAHLGGVVEPVQERNIVEKARKVMPRRQEQVEYAQEDYEDYQPQPQKPVKQNPRPRPESYEIGARYSDYGYGEEAMGISERFERYQRSIMNRRGQPPEQPEEEYPFHNPARTYQAQEPAKIVEPEFELEEEFDEPEEQPAPRPQPQPIIRKPPTPIETKTSRFGGSNFNRETVARPAPKPQPKNQPSTERDVWDDEFYPDEEYDNSPPLRQINRPTSRPDKGGVVASDNGKKLIQEIQQSLQNIKRPNIR